MAATDAITELQQARNALQETINNVDQNIKKLTGRDPAEQRAVSRKIQLKRNSYGGRLGNQPPSKQPLTERRRWGSVSMDNTKDSMRSQEEKKPTVLSTVVVTPSNKPVVNNVVEEDKTVKTRNRRMFGLLVGTLKQFKKESQIKTEQECKREEMLHKVEEQVAKEKMDALTEKKELYQSRRDKQKQLKDLDFKLEMAKLGVDLREHYDKMKDFIQLKSTPRIFYAPKVNNDKTKALLEESRAFIQAQVEERVKELENFSRDELYRGKSSKDPIVIFDPKADLKEGNRALSSSVVVKPTTTSVEVSEEGKDTEAMQTDEVVQPLEEDTNVVAPEEEKTPATAAEDVEDTRSPEETTPMEGDSSPPVEDIRKVVSDSGNFSVVDERVVQLAEDEVSMN